MCCGILRHVRRDLLRHVRRDLLRHVHHDLLRHDLHGRGLHGRQASLGQPG